MPVHQVRHFRLFDVEQGGDLPLLELPVLQQLIDMKTEFRPREQRIGVLQLQIREDVAGAFLALGGRASGTQREDRFASGTPP